MGELVTNDYLRAAVCDSGPPLKQVALRSLISRLRAKLGAENIETVKEEGYILRDPSAIQVMQDAA